MCGILGFIGDRAIEIKNSDLQTINHRGPDDSGIFYHRKVWFGHRRLSILDLSENGHQPIISADGNYVLIFNGEIYNHLLIRKELLLKGYLFNSSSDTQTLLYALIEYGSDILNKLNGIFAFAFYDIKLGKVIIARDQFGVKPLYYFKLKGSFGFGSEIKALLNLPDFSNDINYSALYNYLQLLYAPGELTPFKHVQKLLPGHFIIHDIESSGITFHKYYELNYNKLNFRSESELVNSLDKILVSAVEKQLLSDVPVGFFLSGGLDSSLIVAIAQRLSPDKMLECFTISAGSDLEKEGFSDDLAYAKIVANHLKVNLNIIPADLSFSHFFDKMIWHLDEPQADIAPLHVFNIANAAKSRGIKVLLGGTGGDDLFSGYRRHEALNIEKFLLIIPKILLNVLSKISFSFGGPFARRVQKILPLFALDKIERLISYHFWTSKNTIKKLFRKGIYEQLDTKSLPKSYFASILNSLPPATGDLDKMLFIEMNSFLPDHNLNYTDKLSMATGVETRVPYLDLDLVNFANSLPEKYKMRGHTTKYLLKKVAEKYLPMDVIYRKKTGFAAPVRHWINTNMKEMISERLSEKNINEKGLFNYLEVQKLIKDTEQNKVDGSYTILSLLAIDSWVNQFKAADEL